MLKEDKRTRKLSTKFFTWASILLVAILIFTIGWHFLHNYAKDQARPLEKALIKQGAVLKCSSGDAGHGPDNFTPWYAAYYELALNRHDTLKAIEPISEENGYLLRQMQSDPQRPWVSSEAYKNTYYDPTSKWANYPGIKQGNVKVSFALNNDGTNSLSGSSCAKKPGQTYNNGPNRTGITLEVSLPETNW